MAILNPNKPGYAVLEVNKLESRTTGNMIANAPLATDFTCNGKTVGQTFAENGMLLKYDPTSTKGNRYGAIVGTETQDDDGVATIGLVWATEHQYHTYDDSLQFFKMDRPGNVADEAKLYEALYGQQKYFNFYPRIFSLKTTDTFTTDAIDLGEFADIDAVKTAMGTGPVYVDFNNGYSKLANKKTAKTFGVVEMVTTCPDGIAPAIKIRVIGEEVFRMGGTD